MLKKFKTFSNENSQNNNDNTNINQISDFIETCKNLLYFDIKKKKLIEIIFF